MHLYDINRELRLNSQIKSIVDRIIDDKWDIIKDRFPKSGFSSEYLL